MDGNRLRYAVIGVGAKVLAMHRAGLALDEVELVAATDVNEAGGRAAAEGLGCPFYVDHRGMLEEERPDVAVIMTPHPFHAPVAADCFEAGAHVLVEKPIAVHAAEADAMIEAAEEADRLLAVSFQRRYRPEVMSLRRVVREDLLGEIQRVDLVTEWPRTAAYYGSAGWRATWAGEGGGILVNQAPHYLDLLCYLMGLPERVFAWTRTLFHNIETEDTAHAIIEWPGGSLGYLHTSTAEAEEEDLRIVGTAGQLKLDRNGLTLERYDADLREVLRKSTNMFDPPLTRKKVALEPETDVGDQHAAVYRNLNAAIRGEEELVCDGREGRQSLELANAMIQSSHTRAEVELPLERGVYAALLEDLKSRSAVQKGA